MRIKKNWYKLALNLFQGSRTMRNEIIFVDDESRKVGFIIDGIRYRLTKKYEDFYIVKYFEEAFECLKYVKEHPLNVYLVAADMAMPEIDGLTLLQELHDKYGDEIKYFLLSGGDFSKKILSNQFISAFVDKDNLEKEVLKFVSENHKG